MDFTKVERVLIYRLGSLGDTIVALPALHLIERAFPASQRMLLTNMPAHAKAATAFAVLSGSNLVHDFINYPVATRSVRDLARVWWQVRRFGPQVVVHLSHRDEQSLRRDKSFFKFCGAREVIGLPVGDPRQRLYDAQTGRWEHEAARLVRCLRDLGTVDPNDLANWDLRLTQAEEEKAREVLAPFRGTPLIACGPGTKMQAKDWGQENWRELLARLSRQLPDHGLVLVGAGDDAEVSQYASAEWRGPVINLCGLLTPRESASVLKHSELFLGPDSGPMHVAAACGVPCAVVFSARQNPGIWYPIGQNHRIVYHDVPCKNCMLETCIENRKKCITSITVDEMLQAAMEAWKNGQQARDAQRA